MYKNHNYMHKMRIMPDFRSARIMGTREKCNIHSPHVSGNQDPRFEKCSDRCYIDEEMKKKSCEGRK